MSVYNLCCVLSLKQHTCKRWWTTQSSTERSKMLPAKAPTSNLLLIYIKLKSRNKKFNLFVSVIVTKTWGDHGTAINLHNFPWNENFSTRAANTVESFEENSNCSPSHRKFSPVVKYYVRSLRNHLISFLFYPPSTAFLRRLCDVKESK